MRYRSDRHEVLWKVFVGLTRTWGICTAIGLWGAGFEITYSGYALGTYLLLVATVTSFLESLFFIKLWAKLCIRADKHACFSLLDALMWLDNWKRGLLYALVGGACFVMPTIWLADISGVMLVICSVLYCVKTLRSRWEAGIVLTPQESYSRFDDQVDIDGDMEPVLAGIDAADAQETVANQQDIVDV